MTDDLVKRLRGEIIGRPDCIAPDYACARGNCPCDSNDLLRAADRIEALEKALREIADQCVQDIPHPIRTYMALTAARAALGEKKDASL